MNGRRSKQNKEAAGAELALVKAAAWAWYLHGSGAEDNPVKESDPSRRSKTTPRRPSRYKLEAAAMKDHQSDLSYSPSTSSSSSYTTPPSPIGSVLFDSYEIQTISRRLNYVLEDSFREEYACLIDDLGLQNSPIEIRRLSAPPAQKVKTRRRGQGYRRNWMVRAATMCGPVAGGVEATLVKSSSKKHGSGQFVLVD